MTIFLYNFTYSYFVFTGSISFFITTFSIPSILHVARLRHLYDEAGVTRKGHDHGIPRLGGVAIFVGFTVTTLMFCLNDKSLPVNYLICACVLLFTIGLKDDLTGVNPGTKFIIQFIVCGILIFAGDIRLTSLFGIFGINDIPYFMSVCLSILLILLVVNAFNLIDGINGLAAATGIIVNGTFGILFIYLHQYPLATVSFAIAGAIAGFLRFNITPAKIFMGDTGSLLIGLISVVMALKFLEVNSSMNQKNQIFSFPALTLAILIGPIFDTVRIFMIRVTNGTSPFMADSNHIHHCMLKLGFNHIQTTLILTGINIACIFLVFLLRNLGNTILIILITFTCLLFNWMITFLIRSKERENMALRNLFI
jgi:UDP-N-acetylmuramyl pentapeptide phosphotransferase/UDP-N-acetylglucosamine-1-phosphate transferase